MLKQNSNSLCAIIVNKRTKVLKQKLKNIYGALVSRLSHFITRGSMISSRSNSLNVISTVVPLFKKSLKKYKNILQNNIYIY